MRRLQDMGVGWKLGLSLGSILLLMLAVNGVSYRTVAINSESQQAVERSLRVIRLADEALNALTDMETGYRGYLLTGRPEFLEPYTSGEAIYAERVSELEQSASSPDQLARWRDIELRAQQWQVDITQPGIAERQASPAGAPPADLVGSPDMLAGKQQFDGMRGVFATAMQAEQDQLTVGRAAATAANDGLIRTLILGTVVALALGATVAGLLTRDLTWAIGRLAGEAGHIASGDLGQRIGLHRRDEVGRAAQAVDRMAASLRATIERLEASQAQLRQQQTELERSNRELQDFASVASHDLQEPLRKVQAFGDRLRSRFGDRLEPEAADYLSRMQAAAERMQTLINDLLSFSQVTTRAQPFVSVDLETTARQVIADLEVRIHDTDATVVVGELPTIEADATQMRQLLQNLIANALKFHRPDVPPEVRVSATTDDLGMVWLSVEDNGIGFDEKYLDRIFTIFQRLHTRGDYAGTGIGLAVCQKIVERHGGTISARAAPQRGATFIVSLPSTHQSPVDLRQNDPVLQEVA